MKNDLPREVSAEIAADIAKRKREIEYELAERDLALRYEVENDAPSYMNAYPNPTLSCGCHVNGKRFCPCVEHARMTQELEDM